MVYLQTSEIDHAELSKYARFHKNLLQLVKLWDP